MNRKAFALIPDDMKWVMVDDARPLLRQHSNILGTVKEDGTIQGTAVSVYYDYAKTAMLDSSDEDDKEDGFLNKRTVGLKIFSVKQENAEDNPDPLVRTSEFTYEPQNSDNFYFINPQFLFLKKENPFTTDTRNTDIDFGCNQKFDVRLQLTFPSSFQIEQLPKNIFLRAPDTSFFFRRFCSSDSTHVLVSETFEVNESIFDKENYPAIKDFFAKAYALMQEEVVLKKRK